MSKNYKSYSQLNDPFLPNVQRKTEADSSLRSDGITLTFQNIFYSVTVKNRQSEDIQKAILKGVSGICKPGQLTVLMGPSGGGKTTLLNLLACRNTTDEKKVTLQGDLLANGSKYDSNTFSKFAGYLMQDDILFETQTPREAINFAAILRMHADPAQRKARVEELLRDLQLEAAADTYIGGIFTKGISGGERKRTSLAVELVNDPTVLLLDEPTSGLDSFTSFVVINLLKRLSRKGKTITFTIHQPSSDIFSLFDQLFLISNGEFLYQGDAFEGIKYFDSIGYKFPEYANPADHYIQLAHRTPQKELYQKYNSEILPQIIREIRNVSSRQLIFDNKQKGLMFSALQVAKRAAILFKRHPVLLKARILIILLIAFLMCTLYSPLSNDKADPDALNDRTGAIYFYTLANFLVSLMGTALTFTVERPVFLREQNSKVYSVAAYFLGKQAVDIPLSILTPALLAMIIYYILGFNSFNIMKFVLFVVISIFLSLSAGGFGLLVGSFLANPVTAATSVSALTVPFNIVSGYYINVNDIPFYLSWLQYISPVRYSMEAFMWNEYSDSVFTTAPLDQYNYTWGPLVTLFALGILTVLFRVLSFYALKAVATSFHPKFLVKELKKYFKRKLILRFLGKCLTFFEYSVVFLTCFTFAPWIAIYVVCKINGKDEAERRRLFEEDFLFQLYPRISSLSCVSGFVASFLYRYMKTDIEHSASSMDNYVVSSISIFWLVMLINAMIWCGCCKC